MKTRLVALSLSILTLVTSCKKNNEPEKEPAQEEVTIGNKVYTTVKIGEQVWTSANYAGEGGIWNDATGSKPEYGKYYTFQEVQQISIPAGWRIPSENDYRKLLAAVDVSFNGAQIVNADKIKSLTSKTNWKHVIGTNTSGFNVYPGGYSINNSAPLDGELGEFWMSDSKTFCIMERGDYQGYNIIFYSNSNQPLDRFNVRFVKDVK